MGRGYFINGETMIKVKGGQHWSGRPLGNVAELGLCSTRRVRVIPQFSYLDRRSDDFPDYPPDVQWMGGEVRIVMPFYHFDFDLLSVCIQEAMGGGGNVGFFGAEGTCSPFGTPLGKGLPMFSSGNNLISLNILSEQANKPWRFKACYMVGPPFDWPLGTEASEVTVTWRAIPYTPFTFGPFVSVSGHPSIVSGGMLLSSGAVLWDRTLDD